MSQATTPDQQTAIFNVEKLYVKDMSLEIPHAPGIFLERESPQIDLQLHSEFTAIDEGVYEVIVTVTLTAKQTAKDKVMFLIEAKQAGIFQIRNIPESDLESVLAVVCPNILYPYVREVVTDVSVRAGFAPVVLNPVNFEALYQQQKEQAGKQATQH